ncbi:hypothetical protein Q5P01_005413 [Channa striata]|uniref:Uncharacterized protein n=1 Tax=Channa striata TaxID=64152 RepID=A0AA88NCJ2_CHASR|nr:hypothetical protein Q5P01_005413 [Channa striata]
MRHYLIGMSRSDSNITPKCRRRHFLQANSLPEVRRSMGMQSSICRDNSDSASLVSSILDDDRVSATLDPLEDEWMMTTSDGEWGKLSHLLTIKPSLILRKDFVTEFTCLHWAAKLGKPEVIALIQNFANQHNVTIRVDVQSNNGYTPLHIASMHNHMEVVKLLVGAYIRDYSGRKACQYLTDNVSMDIRDIIGAYEQSESENTNHREEGRWRLSKVLKTNLKEKLLRRQASLSRMNPKLQKQMRISQIVHSISFSDTEETNGSRKASFKSRPKTHFFGRDKH